MEARRILGLGAATFDLWCCLIAFALAQPLTPKQVQAVRPLVLREMLAQAVRELWLAVGRRGGKNRVSAALAVYLALFKKWTLAPGEVGVVMVLASDRVQARIAYKYILGLLRQNPLLWREVVNVTADTITLANGIEITIGTADNAAVRGRTVIVALLDEFAFWPYEEATEVLRALRPGMATQPDAMLIVLSTVYAAEGPFFEARRQYFGKDDPHVLYAVATSQQLNPTLRDDFLAAEQERDTVSYAAEYLSIERSNCAGYIGPAEVDTNTRSAPLELPPLITLPSGGHARYVAGLDVSGGRSDAAASAVAHRDGQRVIVDACRRWPAPHDPTVVAREVAEFLSSYGLHAATADAYGAELARSIYAEAGVTLNPAPVTRSEAYLSLLPLMTTNRCELPPEPRLRLELLGLERRTGRSGRDSVDHRPGSHDDVANAVALAAWAANRGATWTGAPRIHVERSRLFDSYHGPVAPRGAYQHPADRRPTDPIASRLDWERDLF